MKNHYILFFILFLFLPFFGQAQNQANDEEPADYCGTVYTQKMVNKHENNLRVMRSGNYKRSGVVRWVPLTMHLVGQNNGSGQYEELDALDRLCELNEQFTGSDIQFYLKAIETHANTSWYDGEGVGTMVLFTKDQESLNLYIVGTAQSSGTVVCGFFTSQHDIVVIQKSCFGPNNTTGMHELGHFMNLPHTFLGLEGSSYACGTQAPPGNEKLDGSNCETAGDRFCDTGPDYLADRWTCDGNGFSSCEHVDGNGASFYPSGRNAMSYSNDFCVNEFSTDQMAAMNIELDGHAELESTVTFSEITEEPSLIYPTSTDSPAYGNIYFNWSAAGNATDYVLQVSGSPTFGSLVVEEFVTGTYIEITGPFDPLSIYYWRVRPFNPTHTCPDFTANEFFTTTATEVGIGTVEGVDAFAAYPNPATNGAALTLDIQSTKKMDGFVKLYNLQGQIVKSEAINLVVGQQFYKTSTTGLAAGVHILSLDFATGSIQEKIIVTQ